MRDAAVPRDVMKGRNAFWSLQVFSCSRGILSVYPLALIFFNPFATDSLFRNSAEFDEISTHSAAPRQYSNTAAAHH